MNISTANITVADRMAAFFNSLEAAKLTWPLYQISGSGSFAVVRHCDGTVVLCDIPLQAQSVFQSDCCRNCARQIPDLRYHRIVELKPPPARKPIRNMALMERD